MSDTEDDSSSDGEYEAECDRCGVKYDRRDDDDHSCGVCWNAYCDSCKGAYGHVPREIEDKPAVKRALKRWKTATEQYWMDCDDDHEPCSYCLYGLTFDGEDDVGQPPLCAKKYADGERRTKTKSTKATKK